MDTDKTITPENNVASTAMVDTQVQPSDDDLSDKKETLTEEDRETNDIITKDNLFRQPSVSFQYG